MQEKVSIDADVIMCTFSFACTVYTCISLYSVEINPLSCALMLFFASSSIPISS